MEYLSMNWKKVSANRLLFEKDEKEQKEAEVCT